MKTALIYLIAFTGVHIYAHRLDRSAQIVGVASWYGPGFEGQLTAQGEIFHMENLTAAHRSLPLGTKIVVRNLSNSKAIVVRVNDRGPYVQGRILDLSYGAARMLGMTESGVQKVEIEVQPPRPRFR